MNPVFRRTCAALLLLTLLALPGLVSAKDGVLTIEDSKFTPDTVTINKGEKLTVTNGTQKKQWIWGQSGDWAFDFRATKEDGWTHEPGQSLTVTLKRPGKYVIGNAFDGKMYATVIVGP
jgi:plastocyanin